MIHGIIQENGVRESRLNLVMYATIQEDGTILLYCKNRIKPNVERYVTIHFIQLLKWFSSLLFLIGYMILLKNLNYQIIIFMFIHFKNGNEGKKKHIFHI